MLELANLSLKRAGVVLLNSVDLRFVAGEFVAIVGPNGAGKSSLMRAISGEWPISTGHVLLNNKALKAHPRAEIARTMAVVPQASQLSFDFLVEEIVALGRLPHGTGNLRDQAIVDQAMMALQISSFKGRRYLTLSGGERQRVQIARAIAQIWPIKERLAPKLLVLDEPTSALDLAQQHIALEQASMCARQGNLVLAVLHDLNLASEYASRLVAMKDGQVVSDGPPEIVMRDDNVSSWFDCPVKVLRSDGLPPQIRVNRTALASDWCPQ